MADGVCLAGDALECMRAALGPLASKDDAARRMQWFTDVLRGLAPAAPGTTAARFPPDELLWVPRGASAAVLASIPHPQRGVSVAYSWMHGVEALRVKCKWGGVKSLANQQAMWLDSRVVPHALVPAMQILQQGVLPCRGAAVVPRWAARADDAVEYVRDRTPDEFKGLVSLAVVATAVWALDLGEPRQWCRKSVSGGGAGAGAGTGAGSGGATALVVDPHKWRLQAEWRPMAVPHDKFYYLVTRHGWPVDLLTAAYHVHLCGGRASGWRVRFADGLALVDRARAYAASVAVPSPETAGWVPAAVAAAAVFETALHGAAQSLKLFDLGGIMRCSTAAALANAHTDKDTCAAFAWLLVAALVCRGVLDADAVVRAAAKCWGDVLVPPGGPLVGPVGPPIGPLVPESPAEGRCGLAALSTMLCLAAEATQVLVPREAHEASLAYDGAVVFMSRAHGWEHDTTDDSVFGDPDGGDGVEPCAPGTLLSMLAAQGELSCGTPVRQAASLCALVASFMNTTTVNRNWVFEDCVAKGELQALLAADLQAVFDTFGRHHGVAVGPPDAHDSDPYVSVRDALLQSRDGWCVGSTSWLRRASTALWWWLLARCTHPNTALRACVAAAAELAYRWPHEEPLLLWSAFVQTTRLPLHGAGGGRVWGQSPTPPLPPRLVTVVRKPVGALGSHTEPCIRYGHTVVRLDAIDPVTLNPIVTLIDESKKEGIQTWLNAQIAKHESWKGVAAHRRQDRQDRQDRTRQPDVSPLAFYADWSCADTVVAFATLLAPREFELQSKHWMHVWPSGHSQAACAPLTAACAAVVDAVACQETLLADMTTNMVRPSALVHNFIWRMSQRVNAVAGGAGGGSGGGSDAHK
jgi:hypothetical protein